MKTIKKGKRVLLLMLVVSLVVSLAACGGGGGGTVAYDPDQTFQLRMSTMAAPNTPLFQACEWFINRVSELTGGNVEIQLFPSSQLGDYTSVMSEISLGSIDLSWESVSASLDDRLAISGIPYLARSWEETKFVYSMGTWFTDIIGAVANDLGILHLGGNSSQFMGVGGNNIGNHDYIFDPDVRKDVLLRIAPFPMNVWVFEYLNYNTTVIPFADLYSALQTGVADCWYGGGVDLNFHGFRDVIRYYAAFNIAQAYHPLFISQQTMRRLPEVYQNAIIQAGLEATDEAFRIQMGVEEYYLNRLIDHGIQIVKPTEEQLDRLAAGMRAEVWPRLAELIGDELLQGLFDFADQMEAYFGR